MRMKISMWIHAVISSRPISPIFFFDFKPDLHFSYDRICDAYENTSVGISCIVHCGPVVMMLLTKFFQAPKTSVKWASCWSDIFDFTILSSSLLYKTQLICWSFRCSWSSACRRCSNYIFILDLKPGFNILRKDNCKPRQEAIKFWDLVWLILEILR